MLTPAAETEEAGAASEPQRPRRFFSSERFGGFGGAKTGPRSLLEIAGPFGVPLILIALMGIFAGLSSSFLTGNNLLNILINSSLPMIIAGGLTICLVMGEYDLSIGAASSFATMVFAVLTVNQGVSTAASFAIVIVFVILIGLVNGLFVSYIGLSALVVTIAIASMLNGLEYIVSNNQQIFSGFPEGFVSFSRSSSWHVPNVIIVTIVVTAALWVMLERTALGRNMRAVGGNATAARFAGVHVRRTRAIGFVICSSAAGLAGILYAGRQATAYPLTGLTGVLLPSFAAAFMGAATIKFGQFNVLGTVVGVLIAEVTANGLILLNVPAYATYLFQGVILLAALLFARMVAHRRGASS